MGDMPCVWCLVWLNTDPDYRPVPILARPYGVTAERDPGHIEVRGWAHAEDLTYGGQYRIVMGKTYFGLEAKTLVSGDAVCHGHAMAALTPRILAPTT